MKVSRRDLIGAGLTGIALTARLRALSVIHPARSPARSSLAFLGWGVVLMVLAYALSCLTTLYNVDPAAPARTRLVPLADSFTLVLPAAPVLNWARVTPSEVPSPSL